MGEFRHNNLINKKNKLKKEMKDREVEIKRWKNKWGLAGLISQRKEKERKKCQWETYSWLIPKWDSGEIFKLTDTVWCFLTLTWWAV